MIDINFNVRNKSGYTAMQLETLCKEGLIGLGKTFYDTEQKYDINAVFMIAHAAIESSWGTSFIAKRNNLFGIAAFDSSPDSAFDYPTKEDCIDFYGDFLNFCYLDTPNPTNIRKLGKYNYSEGMYYSNGSTVDSIHDIFVRYSSSHDFEAQNIANLMNQLINTLPDHTMDQNTTHFQVLIESQTDPNKPGTDVVLYDGMDKDATSNPGWNGLKNAITNKSIHVKRVINGVVEEDIRDNFSQDISILQNELADKTKEANDLQSNLDTINLSVKDLNGKLLMLNNQYITATSTQKSITDQNTQLQAQLTDTVNQNQSDQVKIATLTAQLSHVTSLLTTLQDSAKAYVSQSAAQSGVIRNKDQILAQLQQQIEVLTKEINYHKLILDLQGVKLNFIQAIGTVINHFRNAKKGTK